MNIENTNPIQASSYTIDPAAVINNDENEKRQGESKTEANSSVKPVGDSIRISDDARAERDKKVIDELKEVDRQVQQHEAAHQAAAGELFRGKSFTYRVGPDGKRYAVAGEVHIDTSAISLNPKATIAKMERIRRAASAPNDPSAQDMAVAAEAAKVEAQAKEQVRAQMQSAVAPNLVNSAPAPGIILKETKQAVASVLQDHSSKKIALAPSLQVSILFNTPSSLQSPQKNTINLTI